MVSKERELLQKATVYLDYALQKYLEGKERALTWETRLGEFIAYSGIAYKWHPDNKLVEPTEQDLARRLYWGLRTTREGRQGHPKAITLYQLKQIMEGPLGQVYPKAMGEKSVQHLNRLLRGYSLEPILSRKLTPQRARQNLEAKLLYG